LVLNNTKTKLRNALKEPHRNVAMGRRCDRPVLGGCGHLDGGSAAGPLPAAQMKDPGPRGCGWDQDSVHVQ
jgi:hypothetical protein